MHPGGGVVDIAEYQPPRDGAGMVCIDHGPAVGGGIHAPGEGRRVVGALDLHQHRDGRAGQAPVAHRQGEFLEERFPFNQPLDGGSPLIEVVGPGQFP